MKFQRQCRLNNEGPNSCCPNSDVSTYVSNHAGCDRAEFGSITLSSCITKIDRPSCPLTTTSDRLWARVPSHSATYLLLFHAQSISMTCLSSIILPSGTLWPFSSYLGCAPSSSLSTISIHVDIHYLISPLITVNHHATHPLVF